MFKIIHHAAVGQATCLLKQICIHSILSDKANAFFHFSYRHFVKNVFLCKSIRKSNALWVSHCFAFPRNVPAALRTNFAISQKYCIPGFLPANAATTTIFHFIVPHSPFQNSEAVPAFRFFLIHFDTNTHLHHTTFCLKFQMFFIGKFASF